MNRITLTINGRTVYWDVAEMYVAMLLQTCVQGLGPAREVGDE